MDSTNIHHAMSATSRRRTQKAETKEACSEVLACCSACMYKLQAKLRPPLLILLGDADPEVQGQALAFWHSALPRTLSARLATLLSDTLGDASAWVGAILLSLWISSRASIIVLAVSACTRYPTTVQTIQETSGTG